MAVRPSGLKDPQGGELRVRVGPELRDTSSAVAQRGVVHREPFAFRLGGEAPCAATGEHDAAVRAAVAEEPQRLALRPIRAFRLNLYENPLKILYLSSPTIGWKWPSKEGPTEVQARIMLLAMVEPLEHWK